MRQIATALAPGRGAPPRVLIVDDSAVARAVLARMVAESGGFTVAGAVPDVDRAMAFLAAATVEVILLDLEMPGVDGLTALPDLLAAASGAKVLIVSSSCAEGALATMQALALGAADTLVKPAGSAFAGHFAAALAEKLVRLTESVPAVATASPAALPATDAFDVVAIGASTGGIHALSAVLRTIPATFRRPIVITQHLPPSFTHYFAAQMAVVANRPCDVAGDRVRIRADRVMVAPGDAHLTAVALPGGSAATRLSTAPSATGNLPSVDPMFASLAEVFGARLLAIVLSGMGRDGLAGAEKVRAAGGTVIVQDQASSVVWGMPGAVAGAGLANAVLSPEAIGAFIAGRRVAA